MDTAPVTSINRGGRPAGCTVRPLTDFAAPTGMPVRLTELALHTGFSRDKLLADIAHGYLTASKIPCGSRFEYRVSFTEAQRYLLALNVLPVM